MGIKKHFSEYDSHVERLRADKVMALNFYELAKLRLSMECCIGHFCLTESD